MYCNIHVVELLWHLAYYLFEWIINPVQNLRADRFILCSYKLNEYLGSKNINFYIYKCLGEIKLFLTLQHNKLKGFIKIYTISYGKKKAQHEEHVKIATWLFFSWMKHLNKNSENGWIFDSFGLSRRWWNILISNNYFKICL